MANKKHVAILKQGVGGWNGWRKEHEEVQPDLRRADLREADLRRANLSRAKLEDADLHGADLSGANLSEANLSSSFNIVVGGRPRIFVLGRPSLSGRVICNLSRANLSRADLSGADLYQADLSGANLSGADLFRTILNKATLNESNFAESKMTRTLLLDLDLSQARGLDLVTHLGPSQMTISTIYYSQGIIPEVFLRGVGVPDSFIKYMHSLVSKPIDYYSCFISHSSKDQAFAERLYADLQGKGVRCWFAPEDMKIGDEIRPRIEESIRMYDKLLLVLSTHSVASTWVAHEVKRALNKEPEGIPNVLFPIRLDNAVMDTKVSWAEDIRRTRHIGNFTGWKDHDAYQKAFERLLRDLKAAS